MVIESVATIAGLALLGEAVRSHVKLGRAVGARGQPPARMREAVPPPRTLARRAEPTASGSPQGHDARYPALTVVRPVKGIDAGAEDNVRAAMRHGYRGPLRTLFVLDDPDEPARPIIERVIAEHQGNGARTARILYSGPPPPHRTGKLNAMIAAYAHVRTDLVAFVDSDTRPGPDALNDLVETVLARPDVGAAFAPVVVTEPPRTAGDAGYALLLNGLYGPEAAANALRHDGELPFIMGQCMVMRRSAIEAIGGLECAEGQLVDDMYLGACVRRAGLRNRVVATRVPIIQRGLSLREFLSLYVRWLAFSRSGLPGVAFKGGAYLRCGAFVLGAALALATPAVGWLAGALGLATAATVAWSTMRLHTQFGGARMPASLWWVPAAVILVGPFVLLRVLLWREVVWRGRRYALGAGSRLATRPERRSAVAIGPLLSGPEDFGSPLPSSSRRTAPKHGGEQRPTL